MSAVAPREGAPASSGLRPEIQALRAFAVIAVLLYHLWPLRLSGGFVGVDVFFVVSGFLITAHLAKELTTTGTIKLGRFWARRARRLLPASFLVLIATAIATVLVAPQALWQQFFREIGASALYVENWALAADTVDYLAADNNPSPVQHYWSLGVEEQLYLVWPILLLGVATLASRLGRRVTSAIILAVAFSLISSLIYSSVLVAQGSPSAYFVTPGRVWEFAAGGILALLAASLERVPKHFAATLSWVGWIGLAAVAMTFDGSTPFPGYGALLPVVFTLMVIVAGAPAVRWAPTTIVSIRPVQWLGDISYSTYLWHWPLIVLIPYANERALTTVDKVGILIIALALAALTTRFVEDPVRFSTAAQRLRPGVVLSSALVASVIVVAGSAVAWTYVQQQNDAAIAEAEAQGDAQAEDSESCFGARAVGNDDCPPINSLAPFIPPVSAAQSDLPAIYSDECRTNIDDDQLKVCEFGPADGKPVLLIGDSHSASWFPALEELAESENWRLTTMFRGGCAYNLTPPLRGSGETAESCERWNDAAFDALKTGDRFELAFTSYSSRGVLNPAGDSEARETVIEGFIDAWQPLFELDTQVVVIRDVPILGDQGEACQEQNPANPIECAPSVSDAFPAEDLAVVAAERSPAAAVDLTHRFCVGSECAVIAGGVLVYRDSNHLTATYSRSLAPFLLDATAEILAE